MVKQAVIEGLSVRRQTLPKQSTPSPLPKLHKEVMKPKSSGLLSVDKPDSSSSDENNMEGLVSKGSTSDTEIRQSPSCLGDVLKPLLVRIFALLLINRSNQL